MGYPLGELVSKISNNKQIIKNPSEEDIRKTLESTPEKTNTLNKEKLLEKIKKQYEAGYANMIKKYPKNSEYLLENLEQYITNEKNFIDKVTNFIDKVLESDGEKPVVILRDIDDTMIYRKYDIDIPRPSIIPLLEYYNNKYPNKIFFGILSSRGKDYCTPDCIKQYLNPNYVYSTRDGFQLGGELLFQSRIEVEHNSDTKQYLIDKGAWEDYQSSGYYRKSYALLKIQDHHLGNSIIAIDDYFGDGRLSIHYHGGLGVKDCMFGSSEVRMLTATP